MLTYWVEGVVRLLRVTIKGAETATVVHNAAVGQVVLLDLNAWSLRIVVVIIKSTLHRLGLDRLLHNARAKVRLVSIVETVHLRELGPVFGREFWLIQVWRQNICSYSWPIPVDDNARLVRLLMDLGHVLRAYFSVSVVAEVAYVNLGLELRVILVLPIEARGARHVEGTAREYHLAAANLAVHHLTALVPRRHRSTLVAVALMSGLMLER